MEYKESAEKLWQLLDDVDTASDMFKPSENNGINSYINFYNYVMKKQAERWKYLTTDKQDQNKLVLPNNEIQGEGSLDFFQMN